MLVLAPTCHPQTLHREWHKAALRLQPEPPQGHGWWVAVVTRAHLTSCSALALSSPTFLFTGTFAVPCKGAKISLCHAWALGRGHARVSCSFSQGSQIAAAPQGRGPTAAWAKSGLLL